MFAFSAMAFIFISSQITTKYPQSVAVVFEDGKSYSYERLNEMADALADVIAIGIESQIRRFSSEPLAVKDIDGSEGSMATPLVSLMMSRNIGVIAAILAILKCGAAYVSLRTDVDVDLDVDVDDAYTYVSLSYWLI